MKKEDYKCQYIENIKEAAEDFFKEADEFIKRQKEYEKELKKIRG